MNLESGHHYGFLPMEKNEFDETVYCHLILSCYKTFVREHSHILLLFRCPIILEHIVWLIAKSLKSIFFLILIFVFVSNLPTILFWLWNCAVLITVTQTVVSLLHYKV